LWGTNRRDVRLRSICCFRYAGPGSSSQDLTETARRMRLIDLTRADARTRCEHSERLRCCSTVGSPAMNDTD
jgi:hypothetical protein